jgi:NAD(P)-dependent dehydrogenase (short-subunit alcohol dehydrogenase family)
MLLEKNNYSKKALLNKTVLITGGGGGIGFEASRAFSYMGAKVIIAEIDANKGEQSQERINKEFGNENVDFYQIDISDKGQIDDLYKYIIGKYSLLDIIIHNAAVVPMGAIDAVPVSDWDLSYAVNLRAPVLLTQKFLPSMKNTGGVIVFIPSAATTPYMSAYEIFKSAQVELCNTLSEEISKDNIFTYSVAPGFVKTDTAVKAVEIVSSSMGITTTEFFNLHNEYILDVELAGAGYAVSVVNAEKYNRQMTSSYQVLVDEGLIINKESIQDSAQLTLADYDRLTVLFISMADIFFDQYQGWQRKKLFQKQFIFSDFKKQMGLPAESFKKQLETLQSQIRNNEWDSFLSSKGMFVRWKDYYIHQKKLLEGYEKNMAQLADDTKLLNAWIDILQEITDIFKKS